MAPQSFLQSSFRDLQLWLSQGNSWVEAVFCPIQAQGIAAPKFWDAQLWIPNSPSQLDPSSSTGIGWVSQHEGNSPFILQHSSSRMCKCCQCVPEGGQCWLCSPFGTPCTPQLQVPECSLSPWGSETARDKLTHFVSCFGIVKVQSCIRIFVKLELHLCSLHFSLACCHDNAPKDSIWQLMSRESVGRVVVGTFQRGLVSNTWSPAIPCLLPVALTVFAS